MKISSSHINFNSRNPNIRKADKIVRNVNNNFPMFSTTYAGRQWLIYNTIESYDKNVKPLNKVRDKIIAMRDECDLEKNDKYGLNIFNEVKDKKIGNCFESSWITLGALCANGFTQSQRASIAIETKVIDKRTGKVIDKILAPYDHTMLLSTMNKNVKKMQELVVIDPWLNKAMSYQEAQEYYLTMIKDWYLHLELDKAKAKFINSSKINHGIFGKRLPVDFNINNYSFEPHVVFVTMEYEHNIKGLDEANDFGDLVREKYPELLISRF